MSLDIWFYALASVFIVSIISLVGLFTLSIKPHRLRKFLIILVSFSAGALFGGAFLHLLPEIVKEAGMTLQISFWILGGILIFFIIEKLIHWQHCHMPITKEHVHSFAIMNLIGDGVHNLLDGLIIGAAYMINISTGISTTIAVALHEIPQEIGDFGVLLHGGFSRAKALFVNFLSALTAVLGAIIALTIANYIDNIQFFLIPIAIGGFIYIAGSDLIPELHKHEGLKQSILQIMAFAAGIGIMALMLLLE